MLKERLELCQGLDFGKRFLPPFEHLSSSSGQWSHSQPCQSPGSVWIMNPGSWWSFGMSCVRPGVALGDPCGSFSGYSMIHLLQLLRLDTCEKHLPYPKMFSSWRKTPWSSFRPWAVPWPSRRWLPSSRPCTGSVCAVPPSSQHILLLVPLDNPQSSHSDPCGALTWLCCCFPEPFKMLRGLGMEQSWTL